MGDEERYWVFFLVGIPALLIIGGLLAGPNGVWMFLVGFIWAMVVGSITNWWNWWRRTDET